MAIVEGTLPKTEDPSVDLGALELELAQVRKILFKKAEEVVAALDKLDMLETRVLLKSVAAAGASESSLATVRELLRRFELDL